MFARVCLLALLVGCVESADLDLQGGQPIGGDESDPADAADVDAYASPRRDASLVVDAAPPDADLDLDAGPDAGAGVDEAACNACEAAECRDVDDLDLYAACFLADALAESGPGAGMPRSALCLDVLRCARATGCALTDPQPCFCGEGVSDLQCLTGMAHGPCKAEVEIAAESANAGVIAERLADPGYASGAAFNLLRYCEAPICGEACSGEPIERPDAGVGMPDAGVSPPDAAPPPVCADLDEDGVSDCVETAVVNARLDSDTTGWQAELGVAVSRAPLDGLAQASSGSLLVSHDSVIATPGLGQAGARQCLPATPGQTLQIAGQIQVPGGQGAGEAGLNLQYFASATCSGAVLGSWQTALVKMPGVWHVLTGKPVVPAGAGSLRLRLVVQKPFAAPAFRAHFDNLLVDGP